MSFYSCHSEGAAGERRISKARFFAPLRYAQNDKGTVAINAGPAFNTLLHRLGSLCHQPKMNFAGTSFGNCFSAG
jgi:hypothetical protein